MAQKIVLCCDGTWNGKATGTPDTIVKIFANAIAGQNIHDGEPVGRYDGLTVVYFEGVGVDGTITDHLVDGAIAEDIKEKCIEAYKFVVTEFVPGKKIWTLGFSRGAYTTRCVAGMINNIGIINDANIIPGQLDNLCETAYYIYRSKDPEYAPGGKFAAIFKNRYSYIITYPPIEFMGILDTVGSLGIPKINSGMSLSYDFYDQNISTEVEHVFQALATHDRLFAFEPCFARRNIDNSDVIARNTGGTVRQPVEYWFPGAHYDVGRVRFVPLRQGFSVEGALRFVQSRTNIARLNVSFTEEYSRKVFDWMAKCINGIDQNILQGHHMVEYNKHIREDPFFAFSPLRLNAYDELYNRVKWIPFVDSLLGRQALRDRHIPIYRPATFYSTNIINMPDTPSFRSGVSGHKSRAFDVYESTTFYPVRWRM